MLDTPEETQPVGAAREDDLHTAAGQLAAVLPRMVRTLKRCMREGDDPSNARELGESQMWALHALSGGPQLTSTLARHFNVTNPTMTRIVDALVEKGYVTRTHDEEDRRRIFLELTESGAELGGQMQVRFRGALVDFLSPLSPEQLDSITRACLHLQTLLPEAEPGRCPVRSE